MRDPDEEANGDRTPDDQAIVDAMRSLIHRVFPGVPDTEIRASIDAHEEREMAVRAEEEVARDMFRERLREAWDAKWPGEDWEELLRDRYGRRGGAAAPWGKVLDGRARLQALEDMPEGLDPAEYLDGRELEKVASLHAAGESTDWYDGGEIGLPGDWDSVRRRSVDRPRLARRLDLSAERLSYERGRYERALGRLVTRRKGRASRRRTVLEARYSALLILQRRLRATDS